MEVGLAEAQNGKLLAFARKRQYVFITRDADFTDLTRYPLGRHAGIVYLRVTPSTMVDVHRTLIEALHYFSTGQLRGSLLIIEPGTYRLRRPLS